MARADPTNQPARELAAPLAGVDVVAVAMVVGVTVVLRFVTSSALWLDEALSVNIASLPPGEIVDALRQDGHPPLYYLLLHGWMELFGDGDVAVRALSGVFSVGALPLAFSIGRRRSGSAGGAAVLFVLALTPYSLRYATEARMYSLVSLLALAGWLLADDLRRDDLGGRAIRWRWLGLALVTGAALLTHYWTIHLGVAAVACLAWRWWRLGARRDAVRIGSALAAGAALFVPWMPILVHQATSTGTPWGTRTRPTRAVLELAGGLGGGETFAEGVLFGIAVLALAVLGLLLVERDGVRMVLDLRTAPAVRSEGAVVSLTLFSGLLVGALTNAAFVARYAAVLVPLLIVMAGVGLARLPAPLFRRLTAVALVLLGGVGAVFNVIDDRTQGERFAEAIEAGGEAGDVVVLCPDQLGPATLRSLPSGFEAVGIPALERPERIDWVDYADRNRSADPDELVGELLERAGDRTIWVVHAGDYRTYEGLCESVIAGLARARPGTSVVVAADPDVFEHATLQRFEP